MFNTTNSFFQAVAKVVFALAVIACVGFLGTPAMAELAADSYYVTEIDAALLTIQDVSETASTKGAGLLVKIGSAALIVLLVVVGFKWIMRLAMGTGARS